MTLVETAPAEEVSADGMPAAQAATPRVGEVIRRLRRSDLTSTTGA